MHLPLTSRANHAYTEVTIHGIDLDDFEMKHYLLETKEFSESHSAVNIADELRSILTDWDDTNLSAITTDNGINVCAAIRQLGWTHLPCFFHTLQLGVEKVLKIPQISRAIARCKTLPHISTITASLLILTEKPRANQSML